VTAPASEAPEAERAACCVVGGGPAGAVLALLLARQGVAVTLLEAHGDFDRDFRGDVLQPGALDLLGQLGLADRVLALALARYPTPPIRTAAEAVAFQDVGRLRTPYPFVAVVPQVRLLGLVIAEARRCPTFRLVMGARAEALLRDAAGAGGTTAGRWATRRAPARCTTGVRPPSWSSRRTACGAGTGPACC